VRPARFCADDEMIAKWSTSPTGVSGLWLSGGRRRATHY